MTFNALGGTARRPGAGGSAGLGRGPGGGQERLRHLSRAAHPARIGQHARGGGAAQSRLLRPRAGAGRYARRRLARQRRRDRGQPRRARADDDRLECAGALPAPPGRRRRFERIVRCCWSRSLRNSPDREDDTGPAQLRGPKRDELWITPDTRAATLAPYLDAWRRKVERVGTINFPTAARTCSGGEPVRCSRWG